MKAIVLAVTIVVALVGFVAAGEPADAAEATKAFKKNCTLFLKSEIVRNGRSFVASDIGSGCGAYFLRGVGMVTVGGRHVSAGVSDHDGNPSDVEEELYVSSGNAYDDFAYGTVNVHIPYRARCDRYRLYASGTMRLVQSSRCSSSNPS
jgi:hypothetical protein